MQTQNNVHIYFLFLVFIMELRLYITRGSVTSFSTNNLQVQDKWIWSKHPLKKGGFVSFSIDPSKDNISFVYFT